MAYQLQEINRRIQTDVQEFLAECDDNYAQRVSLAADNILTNLEHSPIVLLSGPSGSGKTTTAMKIAEELQRRGVNTHAVAMDAPDPAAAIRRHAPDGVDRIIEVSFSDNVELNATVSAQGATIAAFAQSGGTPSFCSCLRFMEFPFVLTNS